MIKVNVLLKLKDKSNNQKTEEFCKMAQDNFGKLAYVEKFNIYKNMPQAKNSNFDLKMTVRFQSEDDYAKFLKSDELKNVNKLRDQVASEYAEIAYDK